MLLKIENLEVEADGKKILKGVNLEIEQGEMQAILGPNASGKSTLVKVISGDERYKIKRGRILFNGKDIGELAAEERVKLGIAVSWQHPPAIKNVKLSCLLEKISNKRVEIEKLGIGRDLLDREINLNFSGGEKKISELIQILSLNPKLAIFDELDSGLDIKKLEKIGEIIKRELISKGVTVLLITHNGEILNFLKPSLVNVMVDGRIICKERDFRKVLKTIKEYDYEKCKKCELCARR